MERMIFVNLPVMDLERSKRFYEAVGATNEPKFTNEQAAMMRFSDAIAVMLLTHDFYSTFTAKPIADAHASSAALLCLSADSTGAVDDMVEAASANGGRGDPGPRQEMGGMMYGRSFEDPDGHHWEVMWMDPGFAEQGAHPAEQTEA
jgi:predicted lactoylglutathione lyase